MNGKSTAHPLRNRFFRSILREDIPVSEWVKDRILGLGAINFYLFVILTVTGTLLMFSYVPSTTQAYNDIKDLGTVVSFGTMVRNMHHWAGFLMIVSVFLHLSRVFFTAEFREPRQFNWIIGLSLFLMVLMMGYTGYALQWDQKSYWGLTIMSNIVATVPVIGAKLQYLVLGGTRVGQNMLTRAYVVHVKILPLLMSLLMAVHFWRIWKDDHIIASSGENAHGDARKPEETAPVSWGFILTRETSKFLMVLLLVLGLALLFNSPLEAHANPKVTPNPAKAAWFFVGLQEMLSWGWPFWTGIVIPSLVVVGLAAFPYFEHGRKGIGVWFHPSRRLQNILFTAGVTIAIGLIIVGEFMRGPGWLFHWPWQH